MTLLMTWVNSVHIFLMTRSDFSDANARNNGLYNIRQVSLPLF